MKLITAIIATIILASNVQAQTNIDMCSKIGDLVESIMVKRQSGAPLTTMLKANKSKSMQKVIVDAYDTPRFASQEMITKTAGTFRNKYELACIKKYTK